MVSKSKERILFENHKNPYNLKWSVVQNRMRKGEDFEQAISYPLRVTKERTMFKNHENPYGLKWYAVRKRIKRRIF